MSGRGPPPRRNGARPADREAAAGCKHRVLSQCAPADTESIADAAVIKDGDVFFLSRPDGEVPLGGAHGFGLYVGDTRYVDGYELRLAGRAPEGLGANAVDAWRARLQLTNPDLVLPGGETLPRRTLGLRWVRVVDGDCPALQDALDFTNHGQTPIDLPVKLTFRARFEDVFVVRGLVDPSPVLAPSPRWIEGALHFRRQGEDGCVRGALVAFEPQPDAIAGACAMFRVRLAPGETRTLRVSLCVRDAGERRAPVVRVPDLGRAEARIEARVRTFEAGRLQLETDSVMLRRIYTRAVDDLATLRSKLGDRTYVAAGIPWFATLFGRDSLVTGFQTLPADPDIAADTLRLLAGLQATVDDDWRDAEPGKILHELRAGELARIGRIPHTPYYGSVDATPLFVLLVARHAAWTGDPGVFLELRGAVERALGWIEAKLDGGWLDYASAVGVGLANQGWKDSGDAIVNADGSLGAPPIAVVEAQGYAAAALAEVAEVFARVGDVARAEGLRARGEAVRARIEREFWMPERGTYALALQAGGRPCAVVASNAGHLLWCGVPSPERARRVAATLLDPAMFSGWGVRTLGTSEPRYNPVGYHLGTVWPHDNSILAAGLRRYGLDRAALRIVEGIFEAALHFDGERLPELFSGHDRADFEIPIRYPVACHPQAWGAGAAIALAMTTLGLQGEGFARRLRVVRPRVPSFADVVTLRGLRVAGGVVDLSVRRDGVGARVEVLRAEGVDVVVEEGGGEDGVEAGAVAAGKG